MRILMVGPLLLLLPAGAPPAAPQADVLGVREWWGSFNATLKGEFVHEVVTKGIESEQKDVTTHVLDRVFSGAVHLSRTDRGYRLPGLQGSDEKSRHWSGGPITQPVLRIQDSMRSVRTNVNQGRTTTRSETQTSVGAAGPDLRIESPMLAIDTEARQFHLQFAELLQGLADGVGVELKITHTTVGEDGKSSTQTMEGGTAISSLQALGVGAEGYDEAVIGRFYRRPWAGSAETIGDVFGMTLKAKGMKGSAALVFSWTLSSKPPLPIKLVLKPAPNYAAWRPEGGENESVPGNSIYVLARLEEEGKPVPAQRATSMTFRLIEASREPGVCINWPPKSASSAPDLQFRQELQPNRGTVSEEGLTLKIEEKGQVEALLCITAHDFGGFAQLQGTAVLDSGRELTSVVQDQPGRNSLRLPKSDEGSWIADGWKQATGASGADDADDESDPRGEKVPGDGLTLYEEYRGFRMNGSWYPGLPKKKDLFVLDRVGFATKAGFREFETVSGIQVHDLFTLEELGNERVINANHGKGPHLVDQHWIPVDLHDDSTCCEAKGGPGNPGKINYVGLSPDFHGTSFPDPGEAADDTARRQVASDLYWQRALVHELFHCVNVWHHGDDFDITEFWLRKQDADGVWKAWRTNDAGEAVGPPIRVFTESGQLKPARQAAGTTEALIGKPHGLNSGFETCVMRYDTASFYEKAPNEYFHFPARQAQGGSLCSAREGVDFNKNPRVPGANFPRWRFGSASAGRGDCRHQIHVTDAVPAESR